MHSILLVFPFFLFLVFLSRIFFQVARKTWRKAFLFLIRPRATKPWKYWMECQDKVVTIRSKKEKAAYSITVFLNNHSLKIWAFIILIWNLLIQMKLGMLGISYSYAGSIKYSAGECFNSSINLPPPPPPRYFFNHLFLLLGYGWCIFGVTAYCKGSGCLPEFTYSGEVFLSLAVGSLRRKSSTLHKANSVLSKGGLSPLHRWVWVMWALYPRWACASRQMNTLSVILQPGS